MEPGAIHYMNTVDTAVYKTGDIAGFEGKTLVINAGAENLDVFEEVSGIQCSLCTHTLL
jgi:hypothetical protein